MTILGKLMFEGVQSALTSFDQELAAQAFVAQCVDKLRFYERA